MPGSSRAGRACLGEDTLAAFAEGQVDEGGHERIEEHLADCADCRAVLTRAAGIERWHGESSGAAADTEVDAEALDPGARVGRYVVERRIGRGAMGTVYAANDPDLNRRVAVKLLRAGALSDAARQRTRARLLREAQAMARLSHPEVITVYDVGAFGHQLFVAMEYVEGETLRRWCAAQPRGSAEILAVYERAGRGLAAAHEAGLVHRDFKPDNVLVGRDGRVRVTDFGLARSVDRHDRAAAPHPGDVRSSEAIVLTTTLTRTGTLVGTPAYMAPEQLRGGAADARSDVFSFCVALYEALYGERPFAGSTVLVLQAAIEQGAVRAAPLLTRIPTRIRTVLLRGLRAAPDERWVSMSALLDALRRASTAPRQYRPTVAAVAGGLVLLVAIGMAARSAPRVRRNEIPIAKSGPTAAGTLPVALTDMGEPAVEGALRAQDAFANIWAPAATQPARSAAALAISTPVPRPSNPLKRARAAPSAAPTNAPRVGNNGALILE
jgi:tRNA A-37 threonylcarbamoyl transferase component Bud32